MTMENRPFEDVFVSSIKNGDFPAIAMLVNSGVSPPSPPLRPNLRIWLTQSVLDEPAGKLKLRAMKKGPCCLRYTLGCPAGT